MVSSDNVFTVVAMPKLQERLTDSNELIQVMDKLGIS